MRARLKVSRAGVELIKSFEGLRQTAARLPDGRWTLGYGHTFSARDGAKVTPEDAEALLRFDLLPVVDGLNNNIVVPLSQPQFDALVSFCFNIGLENFVSSNVLKRINEGRLMEAALAMESWRSAEFGGQTYVLAPLIRRRAAEKNLFLTPVEADNSAPSMLVRPMEDPRLGQGNPSSRPAELDAPLLGDPLQMRPVGEPEATSPYASPYGTPVQAAPVAPSYGSDRSYIDLSAAPQAELPRAKPVIVRVADLGPETPISAPVSTPVAAPAPMTGFAPSTFTTDAEPMMSPQVRAALEQAQAEADARARAEGQRRADEARYAEEARLRETRLAEEAQRQAQALAAARAEQDARQAAYRIEEDKRLEEEHRQNALRLEEEKTRQAQAEEALRLEAARQDAQRQDALRQEAQRQDEQRLAEAQRQAEFAAAEAAKAAATPVAPVEIKVADAPQPEAPKPEAPKSDAPTSAEETKRNEAMASLMRFYSPYGASPMGKPLGALRPTQAPATPQPATQAAPSTTVAPPSVAQTSIPAPVSSVPPVTVAVADPTADASKPVYPAYPPSKPSEGSVSPTPGLVIDTQEPTILSPSALVPPAVFAATPQSTARPVEAPLEIGRSNPGRQAAAEAQVSWREKLDRPLPTEFPKPAAVAPVAAATAAVAATATQATPYHSPSKVFDASVSDDDDLWDDEAARIAMMADDEEDDHPSFLTMVGSSIGWLITSTLGIVALGFAAASFYKSNDPVVVRAGDWSDFFGHLTIVLAVIGLLLICASIAMILKRLGGLKD